MKRIAITALLATAATVALAQAVPPMDCGATPEYPGRLGSDNQKRNFDKAYKTYDKCVRGYVEERKNAIKANEDAAQKAIDNFNVLVMQMKKDSGENVDGDKSGNAPVAPPPKKQGGY